MMTFFFSRGLVPDQENDPGGLLVDL
jgi:hypothetical protein